MNAKDYLSQLYLIHEQIGSDIAEIKRLRELAASIPSTDFGKERVSGGVQGDKIGNGIVEIVELEKEIQQEISQYAKLDKEIRDVINQQADPRERLLLRYRYIEFRTWEQIAQQMDCSPMNVWRIHGKALNNLNYPKNIS